MASQSKTKSEKGKRNKDNAASKPLLQISAPLMIGNQEFVPTPSLKNEQIAIYSSQVLIPFTLASKTLGFMGPVLDIEKLPKLKKFFLTHHSTKPIASMTNVVIKTKANDEQDVQNNLPQKEKELIKIPLNLDFVTEVSRPFRSGPSKDDQKYLGWLARVEKVNLTIWKELGIFDLIHLSKYGPEYC